MWKTSAEMQEERLLLKVERGFSFVETSSFNKGVLGKDALKDTP